MKEEYTVNLGGSNGVTGISKLEKNGTANKIQETSNNTPIQMTGVYYTKLDGMSVPKSTVLDLTGILPKYEGIGDAFAYKPYNSKQTADFYDSLGKQPLTKTDIASNEQLELT